MYMIIGLAHFNHLYISNYKLNSSEIDFYWLWVGLTKNQLLVISLPVEQSALDVWLNSVIVDIIIDKFLGKKCKNFNQTISRNIKSKDIDKFSTGLANAQISKQNMMTTLGKSQYNFSFRMQRNGAIIYLSHPPSWAQIDPLHTSS